MQNTAASPLPMTFPYKPKPWMMALIAFFMTICTAVMLHTAQSNTQGMRLFNLIDLDPQGASYFYGFLTALSALSAITGFVGIWVGTTSRNMLKLTSEAVICPKSAFSSRYVTVPLNNITRLKRTSVKHQVFLQIHHINGSLSIVRQMFINNEEFETFVDALTNHLAGESAPSPN